MAKKYDRMAKSALFYADFSLFQKIIINFAL